MLHHDATSAPVPATLEFCGIPFRSSSPADATTEVIEAAVHGPAVHVHLLNAYSVVVADRDPLFAEAVASGVNYPDGKPLAILTKRSRPRLIQVRGPGLFEQVLDQGRNERLTHFLLGSTDQVLEQLERAIASKYPGAHIAGSFSPPFRSLTKDELNEQDEMIRESGANIVWVGLGTPKQDLEVKRIVESLGVTAVAVGAAFDFTAGTKRVAPAWMQRTGLEWLHRLLAEPRRLWKRYLIGNCQFLWLAFRSRWEATNT